MHALVRLGDTGWAATTRDGRLVVWNRATPSGNPDRVLADGLGPAAPLAVLSDGRYLFTASNGEVAVREAASGTAVASIAADSPVTAVSVDTSGHRLLIAQGDQANIIDITGPSSPKAGPALAHPGGSISAAALAPDGRTATTTGRGVTTVWELPQTGEPTMLATLPVGEATTLAYSTDAAVLATATGSAVHLWSVPELLLYRPAQVQATVNGSYILTSGPTTPAHIWGTRRAWSEEPVLEHHSTLDGPVRTAHAIGGMRDLQPVLGLGDDPTNRACQLAGFTHER